MASVSQITQAAIRNKAAIITGEQGAATELTMLYTEAYENARKQLFDVVRAIRAEADATGQEPLKLLYQRQRLEKLVIQIASELKRFSKNAGPIVSDRQRALLELSQKHASELLQLQGIQPVGKAASGVPTIGEKLPNRFPTFERLPVESIENVVGFTGNGSPLGRVLDEILVSDGSRRFRETLVDGLTRGLTDREMARNLAQNMGAPYARTLTVLRTEGMRAYREGQRQFHEANSDVIENVIWFASLSPDTCAACLAMHGTEHPADYVMESHPNCRCVLIPKTKSFAALGYKGREVSRLPIETGNSWFNRQSEAKQREILGPSKFEAFKSGKIALDDLRHHSHSDEWGGMYSVASLDQALKNAASRAG